MVAADGWAKDAIRNYSKLYQAVESNVDRKLLDGLPSQLLPLPVKNTSSPVHTDIPSSQVSSPSTPSHSRSDRANVSKRLSGRLPLS
jgi:hypothetical protein